MTCQAMWKFWIVSCYWKSYEINIDLGTLQKVFLWWTRIDENKHKSFKDMPLYDPETEYPWYDNGVIL